MAQFGDGTSYVIRESDNGSFSAPLHSVFLAGRALPYRPYSVAGEMRAKSTWYPGNPIGSLQMLGSKEDETTIKGWWKDRFIGGLLFGIQNPDGVALFDGVPVVDVMDLAKKIDGIRVRGQLLEVTWDEICRHGYLKRFEQNWHNRHDLEYSITFEWISREQATAPVALPPIVQQQDIGTSLRNQLVNLGNAIIAPFQAAADFATFVTTSQTNIANAVADVTNAGINQNAGTITPSQQAQRTLSSLATIQAAALTIISEIEARTPQSIINQPDPTQLTLGQVLQSAVYARALKDSCLSMISTAADQGTRLQAQVSQTDVLATFVAKANTDLRKVAVKYYGAQDNWKLIATYNGLTTSVLTAGQLIFVPRLKQAGSGT